MQPVFRLHTSIQCNRETEFVTPHLRVVAAGRSAVSLRYMKVSGVWPEGRVSGSGGVPGSGVCPCNGAWHSAGHSRFEGWW